MAPRRRYAAFTELPENCRAITRRARWTGERFSRFIPGSRSFMTSYPILPSLRDSSVYVRRPSHAWFSGSRCFEQNDSSQNLHVNGIDTWSPHREHVAMHYARVDSLISVRVIQPDLQSQKRQRHASCTTVQQKEARLPAAAPAPSSRAHGSLLSRPPASRSPP